MYIHWKRMRDEVSLQNSHKWAEALRYCLFLNGETASYISLIYLSQCLEGCCHQMRSLDAFCGNLRGEAPTHSCVSFLGRRVLDHQRHLGSSSTALDGTIPGAGRGAVSASGPGRTCPGTKGLSDQPGSAWYRLFPVWAALDGVQARRRRWSPRQRCRLERLVDGGARRAAVWGVAEPTPLERLSSGSSARRTLSQNLSNLYHLQPLQKSPDQSPCKVKVFLCILQFCFFLNKGMFSLLICKWWVLKNNRVCDYM